MVDSYIKEHDLHFRVKNMAVIGATTHTTLNLRPLPALPFLIPENLGHFVLSSADTWDTTFSGNYLIISTRERTVSVKK